MSQSTDNNKRIAKNTIFLYFRMLFLMAVNLYTSRIILNVLGVVDYGIFNVVAGVITMLSFITGPLGGSASRYITFALGEGNFEKLKKVFGSTMITHILLCGGIFVFAETLGLWFVMNKLVIPECRFHAALWIYQFSILTSIISLLSVPYNATIIAHEKMNTFAYISIFEVLAKLGSILLLEYLKYDHLIVYGALLLTIQVIIRIIYTVYCRKSFLECKYALSWNPRLLRELVAYSSWSSLGYLAVVGYTQGLNILLNLFFGPVVNAARGIAVQVQSALLQLCTNFQMALNPQITKSYAVNDLNYMHRLIIYASKYSYYVMLLVVVPVLVNIKYILFLWLKQYPDYTIPCVRLTLLIALLECMKNPILTAIHATGKIKRFQTIEGLCLITIVPISYLLLRFGIASPEIVFLVYLFVELITQVIRLRIVLPVIKMGAKPYMSLVLKPIVLVSIGACLIFYLSEPCKSFIGLIFSFLFIVSFELILFWLFGTTQSDRLFLKSIFMNAFCKLKK